MSSVQMVSCSGGYWCMFRVKAKIKTEPLCKSISQKYANRKNDVRASIFYMMSVSVSSSVQQDMARVIL